MPPSFDRIAVLYRWLEYLSLGPILQRTRTHFLPLLADRRQALLFGDGDGRFTTALLAANPYIRATAVDISPRMLDLLRQRTQPYRGRLTTHTRNALSYAPEALPDLVVTHFFLDCLTQPQLEELIGNLTPRLAPDALWLVSDFRIPHGPLRLPAKLYVRALYLAFRILTGLRVTRLPDHEAAFRSAGFTRIHRHLLLFSLLTTELWQPK